MAAIVDADSHLYEPPDMWREFADPADRHLAIHLERDEQGWDWVTWQDRRLTSTWISRAGDFSTIGPPLEQARQGLPCDFDYVRDLPEHYWSGPARVAMLDDIGTDASIVFPHWGLNWGLGLRDQPEARMVNAQSWNRWAVQVKAESGPRLHPAGQVDLVDLDWAERQLQMLSAAGIKLAWIPAGLIGGKPPSHPDNDRVWSMLDHYGMNPVFHVGGANTRPFDDAWYEGHHSEFTPLLSFPLLGMDVFISLLDLVLNGVMDRHPDLRWGVMEVMTDWVPMLLRRLDTTRYSELSITGRNSIQLELDKPSDYIRRAVRISSFAAEKPGETMDRIGPLLMWSADYPHAEGEPHLDVYRRKAGTIGDDAADAFWGGNAEFLLGR